MKNAVFLLSILLLLSGCGKKEKKESEAVVSIIACDPAIAKKIDLSNISKNNTFIQLETNSKCLMGGIVGKIEIVNEKIFIYDPKMPGRLYCFDLNGKFLFQVGSVGQGPGEYISLVDFTIDKENEWLWLGDNFNKLFKYDLDGNFIESFTTDFSLRNFSLIDEKEGIMAIRLGFYKDNTNLSFINYSIKNKKILYQKESDKQNIIGSIATGSFFETKERIFYAEPFNDTVFIVSKEGLIPYYYIDFGRRKLPKDFLDNNPQLRTIFPQLLNPDNKYACLISHVYEGSNFLFIGHDYAGKRQLAIYSINSSEITSINEIAFMGKSLEDIQIPFFFHHLGDNKFISFLPAHLLTEKKFKENQGQGYGSYSDITDLLPHLYEDDNPVMVIGEYNFDYLFE